MLVGKGAPVPVSFAPVAKRRDDAELRAQRRPVNPEPSQMARQMAGPQAGPPQGPPRMTSRDVDRELDAALVGNGALARVNDGGREHGQVRAFNNRTFDVSKAVPTIVIRNEDFGRIVRLLEDGKGVELEFDIRNTLHPEGTTAYNVVAEIPGTDKADDVVMLGAHIDSWHAATGATDNAIGCAVMMDVVRMLQAVGVQPRRTIRIALWTAEEQGLLGSLPMCASTSAPSNRRNRSSRSWWPTSTSTAARAARAASACSARPRLPRSCARSLAPFADIGVIGTVATKSRRQGGTDHTSFNEAGLPGIGVSQDPIEYFTRTRGTRTSTPTNASFETTR